MTSSLDSTQLSNIIQISTETVINQTEAFIQSVSGKPLGSDTVSVMVNGVKTILNKADYDVMKSQNKAVHLQMKADIASLINEFKNNSKIELEEHNGA